MRHMFKPGPIFLQYVIVIIANFTFMNLGLTLAWLSPVMVKLGDVNEPVLAEPVTDTQMAWIGSLGSLASVIGMPISGLLANSLGRKKAMVLGVLPRIIACFIFTFASKVWMLLLGRCFCGVSDFMAITVTATYASEIASKEVRGALGTLSQILAALGGMITLTVGPFVSYVSLNIVLTCIIVTTLIPLLFLPESPYFLYSIGRKEESFLLLISIRDGKAAAVEEIKDYSKNSYAKVNVSEVFKDKALLKTFGKANVIAIGSQLIGYNAIALNLQTIFILTNTNVRPEISSAVIGCIELLACFCTLLLTDKYGRKPVLATFLIGMAVGMVGLGTFFNLSETGTPIVGFLNYLPLISVIVVVFCFNAGNGSLLWIQIAELFDGRFRTLGLSSAAFSYTIVIFLILRFFPSFTNVVGFATTFWIFAGFCILLCLYILFCIPETKDRTFSDIQRSLGRSNELVKKRYGIEQVSC